MPIVNLTSWRQKYPQFAEMSDEEIIERMHAKYPEMDKDTFVAKLGAKYGFQSSGVGGSYAPEGSQIGEGVEAAVSGVIRGVTYFYYPDRKLYEYASSSWAEYGGELAGSLLPIILTEGFASALPLLKSAAPSLVQLLGRSAVAGAAYEGIRKPDEDESRFDNAISGALFFPSMRMAGLLGGKRRLVRSALSSLPPLAVALDEGASAGETIAAGVVGAGFGALGGRRKPREPIPMPAEKPIEPEFRGVPDYSQTSVEMALRSPVVIPEYVKKSEFTLTALPKPSIPTDVSGKIISRVSEDRFSNLSKELALSPEYAKANALLQEVRMSEIPSTKIAANKLNAEKIIGKIEQGEEVTLRPEDPHVKLAQPPDNVPISIPDAKIATINAERLDLAYKTFANTVKGKHVIEVRRSGERDFRPLENGYERLRLMFDSKTAPINEVIFHRGGKKVKQGDMTVRLGEGESQRIYLIRRIEPDKKIIVTESKIKRPIKPKPEPIVAEGKQVEMRGAEEQPAMAAPEVKAKEPKTEPSEPTIIKGGTEIDDSKLYSGFGMQANRHYMKERLEKIWGSAAKTGISGKIIRGEQISQREAKTLIAELSSVRKLKAKDEAISFLESIFPEDKAVPPEVLAEYPDLQKAAGSELRAAKVAPEVLAKVKGDDAEPLYFVNPVAMKFGDYIESIVTNPKKWLDKLFTSAAKRVQSEEHQATVANLKQIQEEGIVLSNRKIGELVRADLGKMNTAEAYNIADVAEGKAQPHTQRVADFVKMYREWIHDAYKKIDEVGLMVKEYVETKRADGSIDYKVIYRKPREIQNYFPRRMDPRIADEVFTDIGKALESLEKLRVSSNLDDKQLAKIIKGWIERSDPFLRPDTREMLAMAVARGENPLMTLHLASRLLYDAIHLPAHFEFLRTNLFPARFFLRDARVVLPEYANTLGRRYGEAKIWGYDDKVITDRLKLQAAKDPEGEKITRAMVEMATGVANITKRGDPLWHKFSDIFTEYVVISKIHFGTAALPNAFQSGTSTIPFYGNKNFLAGLYRLATDPAYRKVLPEKSAVYTMVNAYQYLGGSSPRHTKLRAAIDKMLVYTPFSAFARMNNYLAAAAGEVAIPQWYKEANSIGHVNRAVALRRLRSLGIDPREPLTQDIIDKKIVRGVVKTQLLRDITEDPLWMNDPRFRLFGLLWRFGQRQFRFMKDEVISEVKYKNFLPLVEAAAFGYLGGELVIQGKMWLQEGIEGMSNLINEGEFEYIPRERSIKVKDFKSFLMRAAENYAAIGTLGFFTDVFRFNDPRDYETPATISKTIYDNLSFALTPVLIREVFNVGDAGRHFLQNWQDRGIRAAADEIPIEALRKLSPLTRYAVPAFTQDESDLVWEFKQAIRNNNDDAIQAIARLADHRRFNSGVLFTRALQSYRRDEAIKMNRENKILEYNDQRKIRKAG